MKKISKKDIVIIVVTILAGLIAHLYMYTNHIVNHDAVFAVNYSGSTYTSGRWLLGLMTNVAYLFNGNYVTPWGIGVVTLCLYAVSAYLIIRAFNLKNIWICCCVGTIMITYPTVTSNNLYIFTAHYYAFAVMLVCLSIYLLSKYNYSVLSMMQASLLLVCSLAIYQGYLPFFVTANIVLLFQIFINQKDLKILETIKSIGKFLCTTIIGLAIYSILNKIILHIVGGQMDTYLGMNKMGSI